MTKLLTRCRQYKGLISRLVFVFLLAWFITPANQQFSSGFATSFYKHPGEHILIQLEASKGSLIKSLEKDFGTALIQRGFEYSPSETSKLIGKFLYVNTFGRNTFYTYISINAP